MAIRRKSRSENVTAQHPAPGRLSELLADELDIVHGGMSNAESGQVLNMDGGGMDGGGEGDA
ncbi:MAG TPA: hypothetical protein VKB80_22140 [Kofleriaceae bacterium]|nr:hypothetical protein [Kofleriaceae bacterium]